MATPEVLQPEAPAVTQIPENVDLGPKAAEAGVEVVPETPSAGPAPVAQQPQAATAQVTPVPAPADPTGPSITIPSDPATLTTTAKGDTSNSLTWMAAFWLRMIKKAFHKHWNVIVGGDTKSA